MLRAENITRRLDQQFTLEDVSFTIESGKITCILGESGSGKTTLLRIIAGFEKTDSGKLFFEDKLLNSVDMLVAPEKRNFGLVFQEFALFPHLTVEKNISFGAKKASAVKSWMEKTGLIGLEKKYPHELSGGQQQRVALARTLASEPKLILMDEPFSNLDHSLRFEMRTQLRSILKENGVPCILVTHDIEDVLSLADSAIILKNGKVVQSGTAKYIYENPTNEYIARLFGKINVLTPEILKTVFGFSSDKNRLIRPDKIKITNDENGKFKIIEHRFMGSYVEMLVSFDTINLIIHSNSEIDFTKLASIKIDHSHLIPL